MASGGRQAGDLDMELTCSICLDLFKDPVTLECGHNFCRSCIDKAWVNKGILICPECRQEFTARRYAANRTLGNLAERAAQNPGQRADQPNQVQTPSSQERQVSLCQEHEERLKLFCKEHETLVCLICRDSPKHAGHSFLPLQDAVGVYRGKLITGTAPLESKLEELLGLQNKQELKVSKIKETTANLEQHITSEFAKLHQFLQDKEQRLIQQLKKEAAGILREMQKKLKDFKEEICTTQNKIIEVQSWLNQADSLTFLTGIKEVTENCATSQKKDTKPAAKLVTRDLSLGAYKGPLLYNIWKDMKSIISPVPSTLTLDNKTAHPDLLLSAERTSMIHSNPKEQLSDVPERFDECPCVLGSEGFTSGKHYWEVGVGNKMHWDIGLQTNKSIMSQMDMTESPDNRYWILSLRNGKEYSTLDLEMEVLCLRVNGKPQKIGVYLDYEEGQVSFYNADHMSHIYTLDDTFRDAEKLYPIFSHVGDTEPLTLFHLKL